MKGCTETARADAAPGPGTGQVLWSVVIPALNAAETIGDVLRAVHAQAGVAGGREVIVVDNGSTDATATIAAEHGATVLREDRPGVGAARARGLSHATGMFVLNTDSDTIPSRRWAAGLVGALRDPGVLMATGPVLGWQPSTGAERFTEARGTFGRAFTVDHPDFPHVKGVSMAFRRKDALAVGGWDAQMHCAEDADLCIRMQRGLGGRIAFVEQATLFHRHRQSDAALRRQARWYGEGYRLLHGRYPDIVPQRTWTRTARIVGGVGCLFAAAPVMSVGRRLGLIGVERAEFERYNRMWQWHFWRGFAGGPREAKA